MSPCRRVDEVEERRLLPNLDSPQTLKDTGRVDAALCYWNLDKLIPSIVAKPGREQPCGECRQNIQSLPFKHDQCPKCYHIKSTSLPTYTVIKYFNSRIRFAFENFIQNPNNYWILVNWLNYLDAGYEPHSNEQTEWQREKDSQMNELITTLAEEKAEVGSLTMKMTDTKNETKTILRSSEK